MALRTSIIFCAVSILLSTSFAIQILPMPSPNPVDGARYGWSSATDGQTLVVGAPGENNWAGAVYVFERNGLEWNYVARFESDCDDPDEDPTGDRFGHSVAVDGDTIVIGAHGTGPGSDWRGAFYIIEKDPVNGWVMLPRINAEGDQLQRFGCAVAIDGGMIAVGASYFNYQKGAVYVYEKSNDPNWVFKQRLDAPYTIDTVGKRSEGSQFGHSVDIFRDDDLGDIIVGGGLLDYIIYEPNDWQECWAKYRARGAAWVFRRGSDSQWAHEQKLMPSPAPEWPIIGNFGHAVGVSQGLIAVASHRVNNEQGSVTLFRWDGSAWIQEETLYSLDPSVSRNFGWSLSLEGDRLLVGCRSFYASSVHLFDWNGTTWSGKIILTGDEGDYLGKSVALSGDVVFAGASGISSTPGMLYRIMLPSKSFARIMPIPSPNPVDGVRYGWSSATDGQTLVVGAPGENNWAGAVYVFERNGLEWNYAARFEPDSEVAAGARFGASVAVDGNTIVVGANHTNSHRGAVYIYGKDTNGNWDLQQPRIDSVEQGQQGRFGHAVGIDGNTIVVGAPGENSWGGAVYVYEYEDLSGNWQHKQTIPVYYDGDNLGPQFGHSVAIDGDIILVGAPKDYVKNDWDETRGRGAAYVYRLGTDDKWNLEEKLISGNWKWEGNFGIAVAVSGNLLAVGNPAGWSAGLGLEPPPGSVSLFRWTGSQWQEKIIDCPEQERSFFGESLSLDGDRLVVAAPFGEGRRYLFEWDGSAWTDGKILISGVGRGSVALSGDIVFVAERGISSMPGMAYRIMLPSKSFNEFRVNTYTEDHQICASVATDANGNSVVVWTSWGQDSDGYGIYGQRLDSFGRRIGGEFRINVTTAGHHFNPHVSMNSSGQFVVVWEGPDDDWEGIYARLFDTDGSPLSGEFLVNVNTIGRQIYPRAAIRDDGSFVVIWETNHSGNNNWQISGRVYGASGNPTTTEFQINQSGYGYECDLAVDEAGDFIVVWTRLLSGFEICARRYNADGTAKGNEIVLVTPDYQYTGLSPKIATDLSGNYMLTWHYQSGYYEQPDIYAQRYDADLEPVGNVLMVNTDTTGGQAYPEISMNSYGQFVIVWDGSFNGDTDDVFGRVYDSNAQPIGEQFRLNTYTSGHQRVVTAAMQESGRFIAVWQSENQDGSGYGVYAAMGPKTYAGDFNFDMQIDIADVQMLAESWLTDEPALKITEDSGPINLIDFAGLAQNWFLQ